jgi:metal-dependent amidase/aminoacylase/carboxypeptidase family protein
MAVLTSSQSGDLIALSRDIHRHPELAYQERHAVAAIAALLGHGCGHNLIAISNVGAFLVAAASAKRLEVGVALIGTPAEENGGGKIDLLAAGVLVSDYAHDSAFIIVDALAAAALRIATDEGLRGSLRG